jgi:[ribosomal protein S5]-alanine N-acetyltransferase
MHEVAEIETERLTLRPLAARDVDALHAMHADPRVMRFWHAAPHRSVDETRKVVDGLLHGGARAWVLVPRGAQTATGLVYYLGNTSVPGMGYMLAAEHWGKGLMTEAVCGALGAGFDRMGLDRVELWIVADNLASRRLAERTGFTRRAVFRNKYLHREASHDTLVYGLYVEEWRGEDPPGTRAARAYRLQPLLSVQDVQATAEFYRDKLGFEIVFLMGDPPNFGIVQLGDWTGTGATIRFARSEAPAPAAGMSLNIDVGRGIDALCETLRTRGVAVISEPVSRPWGLRDFSVSDNNGYRLQFTAPG